MENNNTRKRVYRVESDDRVISMHVTSEAAYRSLTKFDRLASRGLCGLTPESLLRVTRWNGSAWVAISEGK